MRPFATIASIIAVGLALAGGCNGGSSDEDDDGIGDDDDDVATTATPAGTPTFASDIWPILQESCGTANNACHSRVAYHANAGEDCRGWLSLENTDLGAQFYGGPNDGQSTGCPDRPLYDRLTAAGVSDARECGAPAQSGSPKVPYVVPGDASASYLYRKIAGGPYCVPDGGGASDPMPIDNPLDAVTIEVIERWIDGGALP